jgi:hypothetical protein
MDAGVAVTFTPGYRYCHVVRRRPTGDFRGSRILADALSPDAYRRYGKWPEETGMTTETGGAYERTESSVGRGLMLVMAVMVVLGALGILLVSR